MKELNNSINVKENNAFQYLRLKFGIYGIHSHAHVWERYTYKNTFIAYVCVCKTSFL